VDVIVTNYDIPTMFLVGISTIQE